jgi:5-(carboxyamino)imidazole ribonucleotide mutase
VRDFCAIFSLNVGNMLRFFEGRSFFIFTEDNVRYKIAEVWNMAKKVAVIMGSDSDWGTVKKGVAVLKEYGVETEVHVMSAHRTPVQAAEFSANAKKNGFGVIIAAAGMAAHLGGVLAAYTTLPVIGIPMKSAALDGMDALLATVMMPKGVPVATVAIDGAANAAYLALQILALSDDALSEKLEAAKKQMAEEVIAKDAKLQAEVNG